MPCWPRWACLGLTSAPDPPPPTHSKPNLRPNVPKSRNSWNPVGLKVGANMPKFGSSCAQVGPSRLLFGPRKAKLDPNWALVGPSRPSSFLCPILWVAGGSRRQATRIFGVIASTEYLLRTSTFIHPKQNNMCVLRYVPPSIPLCFAESLRSRTSEASGTAFSASPAARCACHASGKTLIEIYRNLDMYIWKCR